MAAQSHADGPENAGPRRRLRAIFVADLANFSGQVSVSETLTYRNVSKILRNARKTVEAYNGQIISMAGDGLVALFESAVDAVHCALAVQEKVGAEDQRGMRMRIGLHLGEVLFEDDVPFGESINVAARLEALADPGSILVSGAVVDAVSARVAATFEYRGVPRLKNIPRRISTFSVTPTCAHPLGEEAPGPFDVLDRTARVTRKALKHIVGEARAPEPAAEARAVDEPGVGPAPQGHVASRPGAPCPAAATPTADAAERAPAAAEKSGEVSPGMAPAAPAPGAPAAQAAPASAGVRAVDRALADFLSDALAIHMGPVARVIVARALRTASSLDALLDELANKIPSESERQIFRASVQDLVTREG
jgi:class 3 adenylate cyclase